MTIGLFEHESASIDIDIGSQEYLAAPWRALRRIAEVSPLFWSNSLNAWVVTRHEDIKTALADRRLSAARMEFSLRALPGNPAARFPNLVKYHTLSVAFMDQPEHLRVRTLMMKAFSRKHIESLRPMIVEIIEDVLAQAEAAQEFDFNELVSAQLPTRIIQGMLGVPLSYTKEFFDLASTVLRAMASGQPTEELMADADAAIVRLNEIFSALIADRRDAPTSDLLSVLVHARDADNRLSEDELLAACHNIVEAGGETTAHMLSTSVYEIAKRRDLRSRVEASAESAAPVVEELLRFPGLVIGNTRIARESFEWHGRAVAQGDVMFIMNCAGNVDPSVFADPETIDPDRNNQASLSFGPGLHHCIGHFLAKMELAEFLHAAFSRYTIEVIEPDIRYIESYVFHSYERLGVRFSAKS